MHAINNSIARMCITKVNSIGEAWVRLFGQRLSYQTCTKLVHKSDLLVKVFQGWYGHPPSCVLQYACVAVRVCCTCLCRQPWPLDMPSHSMQGMHCAGLYMYIHSSVIGLALYRIISNIGASLIYTPIRQFKFYFTLIMCAPWLLNYF